MNRLLTVVLILASSATLVAQATKPVPAGKPTTPNKTVVSPQQTQQGPAGEVVLKPQDISLGDSTIPGDAEVKSDLGDLNLLSAKYQEELKDFQTKLNEKYGPEWDKEQQKIQKSIQKVKDANKWGDDVVFNSATKQWIKLTLPEVKDMKKVTEASAPKEEPKK